MTEAGRDVVYAPGKAEERAALIKALLRVEIFRKVLDYYKVPTSLKCSISATPLFANLDLMKLCTKNFLNCFVRTARFSILVQDLPRTIPFATLNNHQRKYGKAQGPSS